MIQRAPARVGVIRASDSAVVHLAAGQQIVDGAHGVPDEVSGRALADQAQQRTDRAMFECRRKRVVESFRAGFIVLAARALPDGVEGQHHETMRDEIEVHLLVVGRHALGIEVAALHDDCRERT